MQKRPQFPKKVLNSRPMDFKFVEYQYASYYCQKLGLKSARHYYHWIKLFDPPGFPHDPKKSWKEWKGWNDFLYTDNHYLAEHPGAVSESRLMPFWEAVNVVQPLQFKTKEEYQQAWDAGKIPTSIPRNPHIRYYNFKKLGGYSVFLGKQTKDKINAAQNTTPLLALCSTVGNSPNVITPVLVKTGPLELYEILKNPNIKSTRIYYWENDMSQIFNSLLNNYGTQQGDGSWMFSNLNNFLFDLDNILEPFRL